MGPLAGSRTARGYRPRGPPGPLVSHDTTFMIVYQHLNANAHARAHNHACTHMCARASEHVTIDSSTQTIVLTINITASSQQIHTDIHHDLHFNSYEPRQATLERLCDDKRFCLKGRRLANSNQQWRTIRKSPMASG